MHEPRVVDDHVVLKIPTNTQEHQCVEKAKTAMRELSDTTMCERFTPVANDGFFVTQVRLEPEAGTLYLWMISAVWDNWRDARNCSRFCWWCRLPGGQSGSGRDDVLLKDGDFAGFERILTEAVGRFNTQLLAYAGLSNHWYRMVWPRMAGELLKRKAPRGTSCAARRR